MRRRAIVSLVGTIAAGCIVAAGGAGAAQAIRSVAGAALTGSAAPVANRHAVRVSRRLAVLRRVDLATGAGAMRYLRVIGVDPGSVVIQHGRRNYAGPRCPGRGWTCTTARRVLQAGAANVAQCTPGAVSSPTPAETDCTIVQAGGGTATCTLRSSSAVVVQKCDITQSSATAADNRANVLEIVQSNGPDNGDEEATQNATITQSSSGGGSNYVSVQQQAGQSFNATKAGDAISQIEGVNEFAQVTQDTCVLVSGTCTRTTGPGDNTSNVSQSENQQEHANGGGAITQLQNTQPSSGNCDANANTCYVLRQTSASGANTTALDQRLNQVQQANHMLRGRQAQGSLGDPFAGGLDHTFVQSSAGGGLSKQQSNQQELQTQHNDNAAIVTSQVGPVKKGLGVQSGNVGDTATQTQNAQQASNGSGAANDTELVVDRCSSSGNCSALQTVNSNGNVSTTSQSGSSVSLLTSCAGTCNATTPLVADCAADPNALASALASPSLADGTTILVNGTCTGPFDIGHSVTLIGNPTATLDGQHAGTVVTTDPGATVALSHLTITGGTSSGSAAIGGIDNQGTLTLAYSTVTGNTASSPGAGVVGSATGGIQNDGPSLSLTHSSVDGNTGTVVRGFAFGGIFGAGTIKLEDSTVNDNTATATGTIGTRVARAGIEFTGPSMTITRSSVDGNSATAPSNASGGILTAFGSLTLTDSTVSGNSATSDGGTAGGISNSAQLTLTGTTVAGNHAVSASEPAAGGITNRGTATLTNSSVSGNTAGTQSGTQAVGGIVNFVVDTPPSLTLTGTTVSGNTASAPAGVAVGGVSNLPPATISLSNSTVVNNIPTNCDFSDPGCA